MVQLFITSENLDTVFKRQDEQASSSSSPGTKYSITDKGNHAVYDVTIHGKLAQAVTTRKVRIMRPKCRIPAKVKYITIVSRYIVRHFPLGYRVLVCMQEQHREHISTQAGQSWNRLADVLEVRGDCTGLAWCGHDNELYRHHTNRSVLYWL